MSRAHFFGVLLRPLTGIPCVATAHASHYQLHWRFNDFVIANSHDTARFQIRYNGVRANRLQTIYCFTDLDKFLHAQPGDGAAVREQLRVRDDEFLVGIVGDVIARKGHATLFPRLPDLFRRFPQMKLAVIGRFQRHRSYVRKLRRFVVANQLASKVLWTGRTDRVEHFMKGLDLCLVPSITEPLGLVAMEAMASGTPVIASRIGGLPEIIVHEQNGLLCESGNGRSFASAIERILTDSNLAARLVENGLHHVRDKFSPEILTPEIESVLLRVIGQPSRSLDIRTAA